MIFYFIKVISGAGHHVYADKSEIFNKHVLEACALSDNISNLTSTNIKLVLKSNDEQQSKESEDQEIQNLDDDKVDNSQPRSSS